MPAKDSRKSMNNHAENSNDPQSKADELTAKFLELRRQALQQGLSEQTIARTFKGEDSKTVWGRLYATNDAMIDFIRNISWKRIKAQPVMAVNILIAVLAVCFGVYAMNPVGWSMSVISEMPCFISPNIVFTEITRPVVNCGMCKGMTEPRIERNLTKEMFIEKYAYTGTPVLIKDATANWTAMNLFSFKYFKDLYENTKNALRTVDEECQFFPYNTNFELLSEVFNMSEERATFQPGEEHWYIGWSNCDPVVASILRETYQRPFFLPNDSESSALDWIFMGGTGEGAHIHLDFVMRPSWQAQISGKKTWHLEPPPECEHVCHGFDMTVEKGDIIVVDTNVWYHGTYVHPGEISITIGSEYD